jgi:L-ribulose-5-phosphate 3-epimerase
MNRRTFLGISAGAAGSMYLGGGQKISSAGQSRIDQPQASWQTNQSGSTLPFEISLAQWSFNRRLFGRSGQPLDNLDFAAEAKKLGFTAVEYVNQFFMDKAKDTEYLARMKQRAEDNGVKSLLIMCDQEGNLGDPDDARRTQTVENHYKWVTAAELLGCHSIRVNAASSNRLSLEEQQKLAADGLRRLCEYAADFKLNVIVENHGGSSSNADWLVGVMKLVDMPNCGTLPDFGNFDRSFSGGFEGMFGRGRGGGANTGEQASNATPGYSVDIYESVKKMMPYAKSVSAKSYDFDENGDETLIDYYKMVNIVTDSGYKGYINVEYEGSRLSEEEGILATKKLLEKIRDMHVNA